MNSYLWVDIPLTERTMGKRTYLQAGIGEAPLSLAPFTLYGHFKGFLREIDGIMTI